MLHSTGTSATLDSANQSQHNSSACVSRAAACLQNTTQQMAGKAKLLIRHGCGYDGSLELQQLTNSENLHTMENSTDDNGDNDNDNDNAPKGVDSLTGAVNKLLTPLSVIDR